MFVFQLSHPQTYNSHIHDMCVCSAQIESVSVAIRRDTGKKHYAGQELAFFRVCKKLCVFSKSGNVFVISSLNSIGNRNKAFSGHSEFFYALSLVYMRNVLVFVLVTFINRSETSPQSFVNKEIGNFTKYSSLIPHDVQVYPCEDCLVDQLKQSTIRVAAFLVS